LKEKIVILGGSGFLGQSLQKILSLKKIRFESLNSKNCNLLQKKSFNILKKNIQNNDIIIFVSAIAPCKNFNDLQKNLLMLKPLIDLSKTINFGQIIYVSSDAVYKDSMKKIHENSKVKPSSIHGIMHHFRESILNFFFNEKLAIVRPTLIYGPNDTHNGYGPNYFARNAKKNVDIKIFGNGEEIRDHVLVDDVVDLIFKIIVKKRNGIFNAVSANPVSFLDLANLIIKRLKSKSKIVRIKRNGPMPHNGFRCFSRKNIKKKFPGLIPTPYRTGINALKEIREL
jgi:UDP-glucose 4-epimerase